jgi:hypothetical protein
MKRLPADPISGLVPAAQYNYRGVTEGINS